MNLKTFERFLSLLTATKDSDDEVALSAIRQANAILARENLSWRSALASKVNVTIALNETIPQYLTHPRKEVNTATDEEIEYWFEEVLTGRHSPSFRSFLESLYEQWGKSHRLTSEQIRCLKEAYERSTTPRSFSGRKTAER